MHKTCSVVYIFVQYNSAKNYLLQGLPAQGLPAQGLPAQGLPAQGLPTQGLPAQGLLATDEAPQAPTAKRPITKIKE